MPDLGIATLTDMVRNADMIANLDPRKITIADMDTGYGGKSCDSHRSVHDSSIH